MNLTRQYYASLGEQVDVIKLYGSMELAPLVGLGDYIVDVVDTGNTLRANGLEPLEEICKVSSRLIVNKVSFKRKQALLNPILAQLEQAVEAREQAKKLKFKLDQRPSTLGGFIADYKYKKLNAFINFIKSYFQ